MRHSFVGVPTRALTFVLRQTRSLPLLDRRAHVTPRFIRHFNVIGYVNMSDDDKRVIFNTILGNFLSTGFEASLTR